MNKLEKQQGEFNPLQRFVSGFLSFLFFFKSEPPPEPPPIGTKIVHDGVEMICVDYFNYPEKMKIKQGIIATHTDKNGVLHHEYLSYY